MNRTKTKKKAPNLFLGTESHSIGRTGNSKSVAGGHFRNAGATNGKQSEGAYFAVDFHGYGLLLHGSCFGRGRWPVVPNSWCTVGSNGSCSAQFPPVGWMQASEQARGRSPQSPQDFPSKLGVSLLVGCFPFVLRGMGVFIVSFLFHTAVTR